MSTTNSITVTEQERSLLDIIATAESGVYGYTAYYPGSNDPTITEKTLAQILAFQRERVNNGVPSSAIGRYQFIRRTLESAIDIAGLDIQRTRFTPIVQDHLILEVMKNSRGLNQWLAGSLSSADFQLNLAKEFASIPVPYDTQGSNRFVRKGECYYAGDGLNAAGHKAEAFTQALNDIQAGGTGQSFTEDIGTASPSGAFPAQGQSARRIAETATAGGNRVSGGRRASTIATTNPSSVISLPAPGNIYEYKTIDAHDNRYDFRTGQMIRDIGINGIAPISANTGYTPTASADSTSSQTPGVASGRDVGETTSDTTNTITTDQLGYGEGQVDPTLARAANLNVVPSPATTPIGTASVRTALPSNDPRRPGPQ